MPYGLLSRTFQVVTSISREFQPTDGLPFCTTVSQLRGTWSVDVSVTVWTLERMPLCLTMRFCSPWLTESSQHIVGCGQARFPAQPVLDPQLLCCSGGAEA